jgi:CMP-N,N'-diacetyllegionaminic acid synthase
LFFKKKVLCIIPARGGSKGLKLKNLRKINKKTLLRYTCEFAKKTRVFDKIIVSTDHAAIKKEAKNCNVEVIERPKFLSGDYINDYKVIRHVIKNNEEIFDYIVYLQPTSPIRSIKFFKKKFKETIFKKYESCWSITEIDKKFHPDKILVIKKKKLSLFLKKGYKFVARQLLSPIYIRNGNFYIFDTKSFLKKKSIYLKKILPAVTKFKTINIDSQKDLIKSRKLLGYKS